MIAGKSLEEIVSKSRSKVLKERRNELEEVVRNGLDEEDIFILKRCLRMIERLDEKIGEMDVRIAMLLGGWREDAKRIGGVPGVGQVSASAILAEIGDPKRFEDGKKISSWAGLCPSVYQTADKNLTGRVKQGSRHLRRMMVQVAHAATRCRDSRLRLFYLRLLLGGVRRRLLLLWLVISS